MAIEFKKNGEFKKKPKQRIKKEQMNGVVRIPITPVLQELENRFDPKYRDEFYRNLLGIDNAIFFSENIGNMEVPESIVVLDGHHKEFWYGMKLNFAENGHTGAYTVPSLILDNIPLIALIDGIKISIERIKNKDEFENEGRVQ